MIYWSEYNKNNIKNKNSTKNLGLSVLTGPKKIHNKKNKYKINKK